MIRRILAVLLAALALVAVAAAPASADNPLPERDATGWVGTLTEAWESTPQGWLSALGMDVADAIDGECFPESAPTLQQPEYGWAARFIEAPTNPPTEGTLWETGAVGGFMNDTFDLGCGVDPRNYPGMVFATTDTANANGFTSIALGTTAAADMVDRRSWDPSWVLSFLENVTTELVSGINVNVFLPWAAVGAMLAAVVLLVRSRHGQASATAVGSAWAIFVILLAALVLVMPLSLSRGLQEGSAAVVAQLNGGEDPVTAQTERTIAAVHYPAWERRMFGENDTETTRLHAQPMFDATRWTWAQWQQIQDDPALRKELAEGKAVDFVSHAIATKFSDPDAYLHVQGLADAGRTPESLLELGYAAAANFFRIAAAALRVLCIVALAILAVVWLAAAPWLMNERGEALGKALLNNTGRAILYGIVASIGSWGFMIYSRVALDPALGSGWSLFLLIVGVVLFWGMIRPDRKILSLLTMGHVKGYGKAARWGANKAVNYASTKFAVKEAHDERGTPSVAPPAVTEPHRAPLVEGHVVEDRPYKPFRGHHEALPSTNPTVIQGEVIYTREEPAPSAPPAGARGRVEDDVYTREREDA